MSAEFPEDLAAKRDEILQDVTLRGTRLRVRRRAAVVASLVVVFSALGGTVAVIADGNHANRIVTSEPETTTSTSDATTSDATSTTVADSTTTVSTEVPPTSTSDTTVVPATSKPATTALVCHNSHDPRCGPLTFTSTPINQPLELTVEQTVTGTSVGLRIYASDDAAVDPCMSVNWGDGESSYGPNPTIGCVALGLCVMLEPRYGPWDHSPPTPETIHVDYTHVYKHADTFTVTIDAGSAASCSPDQFYSSRASKTVDVTIKPPPPSAPTTKATTTTTTTVA